MELMTILLRTLFTYFFLLVLLRIMGKRELGKLSVFDVVISIMLAEMAVLAIDQVDRPAIYFYVPMIVIGLLEIVMAFFSMKSKRFRDMVEGTPDVIIENGEIREEALRRNRLNLDDLMVTLRQKNIHNLTDVEFAIMEPTGQMSVFTKDAKHPVTREDLHLHNEKTASQLLFQGLPVPLIMDGVIREEGLRKIGQNKFWLKKEIRKHGIKDVKEITFCSIDPQGILFIDRKDKPRRRF